MCDASAGVAAGKDCFWVASDEDNVLRLYDFGLDAGPIQRVELDGFLRVDPDSPEADIEGAARVGNTVYWMTSHGRNKNGKVRESRYRFFATTLSGEGRSSKLIPVGVPYRRLLEDLCEARPLRRFDLASAAERAPKESNALNIEALGTRPDGTLWLGFRNPVPGGLALLVPLLNPAQMIRGARAELGDPVQVDLGGLGVRDMLAVETGWLIVAGATGGGGRSMLYHWKGAEERPRALPVRWPDGFNPEAILSWEGGRAEPYFLLSDDGALDVDGQPCKKLSPEQQRFRALRTTGMASEWNK